MAQTEEDLKNEWKAKLGEEKGAYYHHFWHQLNHMHMVWRELRTIIGQDKDGVKLLSDTIPMYCSVSTDSMWRELIVGLCGFSDPCPRERKKPSLWKRPLLWLCGYSHLYGEEPKKPDSVSFPFWVRDHTANLTEEQQGELKAAIAKYKSGLGPIRHTRNQYIGHWNADAWFRVEAGQIKREFIQRTLKDIEAVLNVIERQNDLGSWDHDHELPPIGGAEDLMFWLRAGKDKLDEDDRKRREEQAAYRVEREKRRAAEVK